MTFKKIVNIDAVAHIKNITLLFQNYAINATNQKDRQGKHVCTAI